MTRQFIKRNIRKTISVIDTYLINKFLKINRSPIIILGNQKSGTSAIAHLLAEYSGLSKTVDIPEIWSPTLDDLLRGKIDLVDFAKRNRKRFSKSIIKEPNLTFFYQDLKKIHPNASFVFIVRDPRSNVRSILDRLSLPGNAEEINVSSVDKIWQNTFDAKLWSLDGYSHYIDILAARWNLAAEVFISNKNDDILLVKYEDFLKNKLSKIQEIARILHLSQVNEIVEKLDIQYQPAGNKNISWLNFFGETNLARIINICSDAMKEFGY